MNSKEYKELSIKEFTKAADRYDAEDAGIYNTCRKNYPEILAEVEKDEFHDLLDAGCGTAPMIDLLSKDLPDKHYVGLDLTPKMIEVAKSKNIPNAEFIVGDCENLPFAENSFDIIICAESFHHYPNPQDFFNSVYKVLRPNGKLILRDYLAKGAVKWFCNNIEMPLANLFGHGDVGVITEEELRTMVSKANLKVERLTYKKGFKMETIIRK